MNPVTEKDLTIRERAEAEVAEEQSREALKKMKSKLKELRAAKTVVANIEREIEDLEEAIAQGNDV